MAKTAITPTRAQDFSQWYQQVIQKADLAETTPVRGCMVIKPWGYAIWERMQALLDQRIKATGHQNIYCPLLIPKSFIEREAEHVSGFAKECAVVTHHRLEEDGQGGLQPAGALEEPYIIRPTSETMIGELFSKWVQSYRELPLLVNQWANVMRWEMRTRLFLRTSEFLWQEGHTAHATEACARDETLKMLGEYESFAVDHMAMPVLVGEKTAAERFPGAVATYCIEAMMQDGKALQAGTSHFLGQNFSRSFGITFSDESGQEQHAWTTSWGVSTRLMGALIMTHGDDDGLVLPPSLAPYQVVILPLVKDPDQRATILEACASLADALRERTYAGEPIRVHIDAREMRGGEKAWHWVKKGVPLRVEIGMRELEQGLYTVSRRDQAYQEREKVAPEDLVIALPDVLEALQGHLYTAANERLHEHTHFFDDLQAFEKHCAGDQPDFVSAYYAEDDALENRIKEQYGMTIRCLPLPENGDDSSGPCLFTGKPGRMAVFAKAY